MNQKHKRMWIAVHALAYEVYSDPFISDKDYDKLAKEIDVSIPTDKPKIDEFFKKHYTKDSGQWVYMHPEKSKLHSLYKRLKATVKDVQLNHYIKANKPLRSVSSV